MTQLQASAESSQYARFFTLSLDMLCIASLDGYFKQVNPSFGSTLGYSEEELLSQPFLDFVHEDDRDSTLAAVKQLAAGQCVIGFTNRYRCKDGSYRWIEWRSSVSLEEKLIYAAARDMTERRQAEATLQKQAQLLELILDSMSDGIIVADENRKLLVFNRAAARILGRDAKSSKPEGEWSQEYALYQEDQQTLFPNEELPLVRALRGESCDNVVIHVRHPNIPEGAWLTSSGRPMRDASGVLRGGVVVLHDDTERKRAERELRLLTETVERMPIGVNIWTLEDPADASSLTLAAYNPAANSAAGLDFGSLIGKRIDEVFPVITSMGLSEQYADIARSKQGRDFGRIEVKDQKSGAIQRFNVQGFPLSGNALCIAFEEVTDRLRAEESIRVYEDTVKHMQTGLIVLHLENPEEPASLRLVAANRAASEFSGLELESRIGSLLLEVFPNSVEAGLLHAYAELARSGQSKDLGEVRYRDERIGENLFAVRAFGQPGSRVCVTFENITERRAAEQLIRAQADALLQLSTPMIPITDNIMVMPLIGAVDNKRAQQVMDTLLEGVARHKTSTILLDITGVSAVDTHVASALIQVAKAVKLLGAEVVLTGIRAEVAQSIVGLGIDLKGLSTRSSLQSAIAAVLRKRS